jgi:predicted metal-dependent phosphotriesterase family hydrolase
MIETVTGQINKNFTGNILMHEYIRTVSNDMLHTFGKRCLDEETLEDYAA